MNATAVLEQSARVAGRPRFFWDGWLLGSVAALLALGVVMVHSASVAYAARTHGFGAYFLVRHLLYVALGIGFMAFALRTRVRVWEKVGPYLVLAGIATLVLVLVPGVGAHVNGAARWIKLGFFTLQPAEPMKLFIMIYVAGYLVRKQQELGNFTQGILMVGVVVAVIGTLLLLQPDFGSAVVISLTVLLMLFLGGIRLRHFALVVLTGIGGMVLLTIVSPYRMGRVTSFMDPWADPFGSGFQLTQALIAFGRGEWLGVGLGASVQKLFYLPAAHTDFLFAVLAEELGLVGVLGVMALFCVIVARAFAIARVADEAGMAYSARLAQGIGLLLGLEAMINMGVNLGMLPTKGLTLPFVSYGGSSMLMCCLAVGILLRIERDTRGRSWGER